MQNFVNFNDWTAACQAGNLNGPVRIQGYLSYAYTDAYGNQVAVWNGNDESGSVNLPGSSTGDVPVAPESPILDSSGNPILNADPVVNTYAAPVNPAGDPTNYTTGAVVSDQVEND